MPAITLCECYAMPVITLCECYAMSGTDSAYGPTKLVREEHLPLMGARTPIVLRARYAMSGTDSAYGATSSYAYAMRCPVLT
eukprot:2726840-Rhodomonas_salina.2